MSSYEAISIREALRKINESPGGWFLPQVQRQFVWGIRDESESYVCLLLDSIFRRYPIGGMVLWETQSRVPHREFLTHFKPRTLAPEVDQGQWGRQKCLVYDGQQRLQTLYSVLCYSLNGRVLCFNLRFDGRAGESDDTGFEFVDKGAESKPHSIRLNALVSMADDAVEKEKMKEGFFAIGNLTAEEKLLVKANLDELWTVFVKEDIKPIAFYKVRSNRDLEVNEIFRRLNTGGIALTQIELTLFEIKKDYSDFEERLYALSDEILGLTGTGIDFSPSELLQFLFLMLFGTPRVDADRIKTSDRVSFTSELERIAPVVRDFFKSYLWELLRINSRAIVPRWLAVLPMIAYLVEAKQASKTDVKRLSRDNLQAVHQYFILSQINDWNTQTIVSRATGLARDAALGRLPFPLEAIREVALEKSRVVELRHDAFMWQPWFALKMLTPTRSYIFSGATPQIDHIFPIRLAGMDDAYRLAVDVLWNFQPMSAEVNNYKRAKDPREFFKSSEGSKYLNEYDYLPSQDDNAWSSERQFLIYREKAMTDALTSMYGLPLTSSPVLSL